MMPSPRVNVKVHIRNNITGEIRAIDDDLYMNDEGVPETFIWEEGNYACDCNRRLFFARANNEPENHEGNCGDTEHYSVNIMYGDKLLHSEFDEKDKD